MFVVLRVCIRPYLEILVPCAQTQSIQHDCFKSMHQSRLPPRPYHVRFAETRLLFSLGSLSSSLASGTWNTYASSFKAFLQFLHTESILSTDISEVTLEMYVCHLAESPGKTLSAATVASYLSGIRTCLKALGIVLADQTATAGALVGYKRFANAVTPPPLQHAAWPLEYTDLAIRRARDLMPAFRAGTLDSLLVFFISVRDMIFLSF